MGPFRTRTVLMMRTFFLLLFVPLAVLTACDDECSTETCTDFARVVIETIDGTWVDGDYSLELEADDDVYSCTFTTPDDAPDETSAWQPIDCTPTINANLVPLCESQHGVLIPASESCSPLPGKFDLHAEVPGTPKKVHFVLTRGDESVLDRTMNIALYDTVQPNGPE